MTESAPQPSQPALPSTAATSPRLLNPGVRLALRISLSFLALALMLRLLAERAPVAWGWIFPVMVPLAALLAGGGVAVRSYRTWTLPMRQLRQLLAREQSPEETIDELSQIAGGPRLVVPAVQDLLCELRDQRIAIAELELEMRQRIANRTDALERTIGSLRLQATRDSLTGLFNRRFLDQYLGQSLQRHIKGRKDLCLLMIDVDHFKVLNDTLGHAAGDDLLRAIGQLVRSAIRGEDVGFRCGGDEFVVLLPNSSAEAGRSLAERLTSLVDALAKTIRISKPPRLSIGMATLKALPNPTPDLLLKDADRSLYEVKRARRTLREGGAGGLNAPAGEVQSPPLSRIAG